MEGPSEKAVRDALARLITRGIDSVWHPDVQPLFELPAVQAKVAELGDDRAADALRIVLGEAVANLGHSQYRTLLAIVLGLDRRYEDLSAGEKRRIAGQEFRGGQRPVSAGTIRQHHEPRALDELAIMLTARPSPGGHEGLKTEAPRTFLQWHPSVHEEWAGEVLVFWRLALGVSDRRMNLQTIREAMHRVGVRSWSVYELFGAFDVLIRAWVPRGKAMLDVRRAIMDESEIDLVAFGQFEVEQIVSDGPWIDEDGSMQIPPNPLLSRGLSAHEIDRLNNAEDSALLEEAEQLNVVRSVSGDDGIGFFLSLSPDRETLVRVEDLRRLSHYISDVVGAASRQSFSHLSVYRGSGFASFLIYGTLRPEHFPDLRRSLIQPLTELLSLARLRIDTLIASPAYPVIVEEAMPGGSPPATKEGALKLLEQEEGVRLEVKGGAFAEWRAPRRSPDSRPPASPEMAYSLARTVTSFLNTEGGHVVIGAWDRKVLERDPQLREDDAFADAPQVGRYLVVGIERESEGLDAFQNKLFRVCKDLIDPAPLPFISINFEEVEGRVVCVLSVSRPDTNWFYCKSPDGGMQFVVRVGSTTMHLEGPEADQYKVTGAPSPRVS